MANRFKIKFGNLSNSINGIKTTLENKEIKDLTLNDKKSILYDFGGCEEQTWKIFKYYLEYIEGYDNFGNASKRVYRSIRDLGLITDDECISLLETIDLRNNLFHEYNYERIDESCSKISQYLSIFNKTLEILNELYSKYELEFEKDEI